jgi:metal-dependent amidase/aminoacylase/carboxypeptidase family protein
MMTHPMSEELLGPMRGKASGIAYGTCVASIKSIATFTGKPAHGALMPHEGINALDAAVLAYNGISMLRQQIKPAERIGVVILQGGQYPNIITPRSQLNYNVRSSTLKEASVLHERVTQCFEGAAVATGCRVEFQMHVYIESCTILENSLTIP